MFEAFVKAFLSAIWILGSFVSLYLWDASGLMKWTLGAIAWILLEIGTSWIDNSLLTMIWWVGLSPASFLMTYVCPTPVELMYLKLLRFLWPILLLFQSVWAVKGATTLSRHIITTYWDSHQGGVKAAIISTSLLSYLISIPTFYFLYHHPNMNISLASYLSISCTILLILATFTIYVDTGILSDIALITCFTAFIARCAVLESAPPALHHKSLLNYLFNGPENQFLSLDFIISAIFALATISTFPLLIDYNEDEHYFKYSDVKSKIFSKNGRNVWRTLFFVSGVMLYTHVILSASGTITTNSLLWRTIQTLVVLIYYFMTLLHGSENADKLD